MAHKTLTQEHLKALFHYDPYTGLFTRRTRVSNRAIGSTAGSFGYTQGVVISIDNRRYLAHRLAWLYMTGSWPASEIDHKNCDRQDNRFGNLREATRFENQQNLKAEKPWTKSSLLGSSPINGGRQWRARIMVNGFLHNLGCFKTREEAHAAYVEAKRKLHPFGEL